MLIESILFVVVLVSQIIFVESKVWTTDELLASCTPPVGTDFFLCNPENLLPELDAVDFEENTFKMVEDWGMVRPKLSVIVVSNLEPTAYESTATTRTLGKYAYALHENWDDGTHLNGSLVVLLSVKDHLIYTSNFYLYTALYSKFTAALADSHQTYFDEGGDFVQGLRITLDRYQRTIVFNYYAWRVVACYLFIVLLCVLFPKKMVKIAVLFWKPTYSRDLEKKKEDNKKED